MPFKAIITTGLFFVYCMLNIPTHSPEPDILVGNYFGSTAVATSASKEREVLMKKSGAMTPKHHLAPLRYSEVGTPARKGLTTLNKL